MNISELVIYRNLKHEDLFEDMAGLMGLGKEGQKADPFACAGELVELAGGSVGIFIVCKAER